MHELGLQKANTWSAHQLPISGEVDKVLTNHNTSRQYFNLVLKQIWPAGLPEKVYVVDSSTPGKEWKDSSVTCLQKLLRSIAMNVVHQSKIPSIKLVWQMPEVDYDISLTGMREIPEDSIRRFIIPEAIDGETRNKWPLAHFLAASPEFFPRGCVEFPYTLWDVSPERFEILKEQVKQDPLHQACRAEIVSESIVRIRETNAKYLIDIPWAPSKECCGCTLESCRIAQAWKTLSTQLEYEALEELESQRPDEKKVTRQWTGVKRLGRALTMSVLLVFPVPALPFSFRITFMSKSAVKPCCMRLRV